MRSWLITPFIDPNKLEYMGDCNFTYFIPYLPKFTRCFKEWLTPRIYTPIVNSQASTVIIWNSDRAGFPSIGKWSEKSLLQKRTYNLSSVLIAKQRKSPAQFSYLAFWHNAARSALQKSRARRWQEGDCIFNELSPSMVTDFFSSNLTMYLCTFCT